MGGEVRKKIIAWDVAPEKEYFEQLFRISRNQVIWGGNYFDLPPTRCFLIWRKTNVPQDFTMAMAEYAWTSFNSNAKVFSYSAVGLPGRFHPSEKPVQLYEWIYEMFAKPGYKILDTHLGSGNDTYFVPVTEQIYLVCKPKFKLVKCANKYGDVWEITQEMNNPHPAPFPVELTDRIVTSTDAQIILDPFGGSGTTAISALKANRNFILIEQSEKYCEMANLRIRNKDWRNEEPPYACELF